MGRLQTRSWPLQTRSWSLQTPWAASRRPGAPPRRLPGGLQTSRQLSGSLQAGSWTRQTLPDSLQTGRLGPSADAFLAAPEALAASRLTLRRFQTASNAESNLARVDNGLVGLHNGLVGLQDALGSRSTAWQASKTAWQAFRTTWQASRTARRVRLHPLTKHRKRSSCAPGETSPPDRTWEATFVHAG